MTKRKSLFISYSSKDKEFVIKLARLFEEMYVSYWKAPEMIPTGSSYAREIPKAIKACSVFLLVLSKNSQESIWVEKEVDCAIYHHKKIIPILIDREPLSDMFRFYLNNVQMIDYPANPKKAVEQLKYWLYEIFEDARDVSEGLSSQLMKTELQSVDGEKGKSDALDSRKSRTLKSENVGKIESDVKSGIEARIENQAGKGNASAGTRGSVLQNQENTEQFVREETQNRNRKNGLRVNNAPVFCEYCGGELTQIGRGTYQCKDCGKENYDDYQKVRNFLDQNGPCNAITIQKYTGVSRQTINKLLEEEFLIEKPGRNPFDS